MILREIKNIFIKNRLTDGVDFVRKDSLKGDVEHETHTGLQQIYQNKLIEGVYYETADWLVQGGGGIIDTKIKDLTNFSTIKLHYLLTGNTTPNRIFGRDATELYRCVIVISGDMKYIHIYNYNRVTFTNNAREQIVTLDFNNQSVTINNITQNARIGKGNHTSKSLMVFGRAISDPEGSSGLVGIKFAEVTFTTANRDILHLVPCQLLRSIPRNLDAQCKERVAGECGMIDLISGKFYGNVASSGTFTVENDNNE